MNVIDAFLYSGIGAERDILHWRMEELKDVVDVFLAMEGDRTFQGAPRSRALNGPNDWPTCDGCQATFISACATLPVAARHPMDREIVQRNAIGFEITRMFQGDDLLLISDVDEIPNARALKRALEDVLNGRRGTPIRFGSALYHGYVNMHCVDKPVWWAGTLLCRVEDLYARTTQGLRSEAHFRMARDYGPLGWHFSFLGGPQAMADKLAAWSHFEVSGPEYRNLENLSSALRECRDWEFTRGYRYEWSEPDGPAWLLANRARFSHYFGPQTDSP